VRAPSRLAQGPSVFDAFGVLSVPDQASSPLVATWNSRGAAAARQLHAHAMPTAKALLPSARKAAVEGVIQEVGLWGRKTGLRRRWATTGLAGGVGSPFRPRFETGLEVIAMRG